MTYVTANEIEIIQLRITMNRDNDAQKPSKQQTQAEQVKSDLSALSGLVNVTEQRKKFEKREHPFGKPRSMVGSKKISQPIMELDFQSSPDSVAQGPFNMPEGKGSNSILSPIVSAPRFESISQAVILPQTETFIDRLQEDLTQNYIDFLESTSAKEVAQEKIETVFNMLTDVVAEQISLLSNMVFYSAGYEQSDHNVGKLPQPKHKTLDLGDLYEEDENPLSKSFTGNVSRQALQQREIALQSEKQRLEEQRQFAYEDLAKILSGVPVITDIYRENQVDADFTQEIFGTKKESNSMQGIPLLKPEIATELKGHVAALDKRGLEDFYPKENESFSVTMKKALIDRLQEIQSDSRALSEMHRILKALEKIANRDEPKTITHNSSETLSERKLRLFKQLDELSVAYVQNKDVGVSEQISKVLMQLSALDEEWQKLSPVEQEQEHKKFKDLLRESNKAQEAYRESELDGSLDPNHKLARKAQSGSIAFAFNDSKGMFKSRQHSVNNSSPPPVPVEEAVSKRAQQGRLFVRQYKSSLKETRIGKKL